MNSTSLLQVLGVLVNLCDCMVIWGLFPRTLDVSARKKVTGNREANDTVAESGSFDRSKHGKKG
jgi:hypothetical protein